MVQSLIADPAVAAGSVNAGVAAALVGAIAAASLLTAARSSASAWDEAAGAAAQAETLIDRLRDLGEENADAYRRVLLALDGELPADRQERRDFTLGRMLQRSAAIPTRIAEAAADVAELAEAVCGQAATDVRPDARAAGALAAGASEAAALLVVANLAEGGERPLAQRARSAAARARASAGRAGGNAP